MLKNLPNRSVLVGIFVIIASLLVFGCKKKEQQPAAPPPPAPAPAAKPQQPPVQKAISSAKAAENQGPQFDFATKKDPFKPYAPPVAQAPQKAATPGRIRNLLPIQSFETGKFKLVGIIVGLKENSALVIDPAGKGYVVRQGMQIGNNEGIISRITSSSVEVIETFREDSGHTSRRTIKLTLPQKK